MSPEEAGEQILLGEPYARCNSCQGEGERIIRAETGTQRRAICNLCFGKGFLPRVAYHDACRALGLAIPPYPRTLGRRGR